MQFNPAAPLDTSRMSDVSSIRHFYAGTPVPDNSFHKMGIVTNALLHGPFIIALLVIVIIAIIAIFNE